MKNPNRMILNPKSRKADCYKQESKKRREEIDTKEID